MEQIKRGRQGVAGWRGVLTRLGQSGLTVRAFCQREGFSTASFYRWQSILRTPSDESPPQKLPSVVNATAGFVDLDALHINHTGTFGRKIKRTPNQITASGLRADTNARPTFEVLLPPPRQVPAARRLQSTNAASTSPYR